MFGNLEFSDAAKFADIARNIFNGNGYLPNFSFFIEPFFAATWIPPFMPYSMAIFFKIFGVSDQSVLLTSFFYVLLTLPFVYLLAYRIFRNKLVSLLSLIVIGINPDIINYAKSGASEAPFIFEIVFGTYLLSLKNKWSNLGVVAVFILMYLTRPQAFIFIIGMVFYYLLLNFKFKKTVIYFTAFCIALVLSDIFVLRPLSGNYFIYSILDRGSNVLSQIHLGKSASEQLRSGELTFNFSVYTVLKKLFYNLYNLYKLIPQIMSPYVFAIFIVGLFYKQKNIMADTFKIFVLFNLLAIFTITSLSIPLYRYIHPVVPLVYISSIGSLFYILTKMTENGLYILNFRFTKQIAVKWTISLCLLLFVAIQSFGAIFLDSRFNRQSRNTNKPHIYKVLAEKMKSVTGSNDIILTNLDTWGSWYGERKTVWYPIKPIQIINKDTLEIPFDAIYLTGYLIDDENYLMGEEWRSIYENPYDESKWNCEGCKVISENFRLSEVYEIKPDENYERLEINGVLLVKE